MKAALPKVMRFANMIAVEIKIAASQQTARKDIGNESNAECEVVSQVASPATVCPSGPYVK
jgi:hypothetical protein